MAVAFGARWGDPVAGLAVTLFICHVGWDVSSDVAHRLLDGVDPQIITTAEAIAADVPGVRHVHARARWTGRTLRLELEAWIDPSTTVHDADQLGQTIAHHIGTPCPTYAASPGPSEASNQPATRRLVSTAETRTSTAPRAFCDARSAPPSALPCA